MRTLKAAQINEDEYFGQILYDELAAILKQIKAAPVSYTHLDVYKRQIPLIESGKIPCRLRG